MVAWMAEIGNGESVIAAKAFPNDVQTHALVPFSILYPGNDYSIDTQNPPVRWEQPSEKYVGFPWELTYELYYSKREDFADAVVLNVMQDTTLTLEYLEKGQTYFTKVLARNVIGDSLWSSNTVGFHVSHIANVRDQVRRPHDFVLYQNYPNPFNPLTEIGYDLNQSGFVRLIVYDIAGRQVKELVHEYKSCGSHNVMWDGKDAFGNDIATGVYLYRTPYGLNENEKNDIAGTGALHESYKKDDCFPLYMPSTVCKYKVPKH